MRSKQLRINLFHNGGVKVLLSNIPDEWDGVTIVDIDLKEVTLKKGAVVSLTPTLAEMLVRKGYAQYKP